MKNDYEECHLLGCDAVWLWIMWGGLFAEDWHGAKSHLAAPPALSSTPDGREWSGLGPCTVPMAMLIARCTLLYRRQVGPK
jgi:hypothetical protein